MTSQEDQAYTAEIGAKLVVLSLPRVGPARARWLLGNGTATEAVERLRRRDLSAYSNPPAGVSKNLVMSWCAHVQKVDGQTLFEREASAGAVVIDGSHAAWPFTNDPEPPLLLFAKGDVSLLASDRIVAIVGTRRCTSIGRRVAYQLGFDLVAAGVTVVSGLAAGIDAAAHVGVLEAEGNALAVGGTGLDVPYPTSNRSLWAEIGDRGLLVTESPRGTKPERWRFPARNRLIAGLVDAVVVVESHSSGGALLTVDEAILRGCPVFAVPGSVISPASSGTNTLLAEGCEVALGAESLVTALGFTADQGKHGANSSSGEKGPLPAAEVFSTSELSAGELSLRSLILAEVAAGPVHIDQLVSQLNVHPAELFGTLRQLQADGYLNVDGATASLPETGG